MSDVRVIPMHKAERDRVRALLLQAIQDGQDEDGMLNDIAEMLLRPLTERETGALSDA